MHWIKTLYKPVLQTLVEQFVATKKEERASVVTSAVDQITAIAEEEGFEVPPLLSKKIENWFQNNRPHTKKKNHKSRHVNLQVGSSWTLRKVVQKVMKARITERILLQDPTAVPGTAAYMLHYQKQCSELLTELTEEEILECERLVEEWNSDGLDDESKAWMAHHKFGSVAQEFLEFAQAQMGVHVFMLIGYKDENGDMVRAKLETQPSHPSQPQFLPKFNSSGQSVWKEWDTFLDNLHNPKAQPKIPPVAQGRPSDKSVPWPLSVNAQGKPILPPVTDCGLPQIKQIVRSFLTMSYRHAANNKKASIPWALVSQDPDKYFDTGFLPKGVKLGEISKMRSENIQSCLRHWYKRQEDGECPFEFKHVELADQRFGPRAGQGSENSDEEIEIPQFSPSPHHFKSPSPHHFRSPSPTQPSVPLPPIPKRNSKATLKEIPSSSAPAISTGESMAKPKKFTSPPLQAISPRISKGKSKASPVEFPSQVGKSRKAQIQFLMTLSKEPEYTALLDHLLDFPESQSAPWSQNVPPHWLSWSHSSKHLPPSFHASVEPFNQFVKWIRSCPHRCPSSRILYPQHQVILMCLGIGLVLQDLYFYQFHSAEGDEALNATNSHVVNSSLTWGHQEEILAACKDVLEDIQTCLNIGEEGIVPKIPLGELVGSSTKVGKDATEASLSPGKGLGLGDQELTQKDTQTPSELPREGKKRPHASGPEKGSEDTLEKPSKKPRSQQPRPPLSLQTRSAALASKRPSRGKKNA